MMNLIEQNIYIFNHKSNFNVPSIFFHAGLPKLGHVEQRYASPYAQFPHPPLPSRFLLADISSCSCSAYPHVQFLQAFRFLGWSGLVLYTGFGTSSFKRSNSDIISLFCII